MATTYEIHPGIGIARVGTSTEHYFVGPEPDAPPPTAFRDDEGNLLRQAARFRVFECERDERNALLAARELTPDLGTIAWTVHLANRKGAGEVFPPPDPAVPLAQRLRNQGQDRAELTIDPGPRTVDGSSRTALLDTGTFKQEPVFLGEIRTESGEHGGRLLVLGGFGRSGSVPAGLPVGPPRGSFANNDDWFDDVSDGPVRALVTTADGRTHRAKPSWVIVAPPDFAPGVANFVTLYDVARDVAVHNRWLSVPDTPSFTRDIYPILSRPFAYSWVSGRAGLMHGSARWVPSSPRWKILADPATAPGIRQSLFARLRDPHTRPPSDLKSMPRLHDDTNQKGQVLPPIGTQYRILDKWVAGNFVNDWDGQPPVEERKYPGELMPDALDRIALRGCSGGAFFPGIEAGRIMADGGKYSEPYRLDADTLEPGEVTEGNAVPWQADFHLCRDDSPNLPTLEEDEPYLAWWPAQRPDMVFVDLAAVESRQQPEFWARGVDHMADMVEHWHELGVVVETPGANGHPVFVETERRLPDPQTSLDG
ncbi:LodA/GoxA family CTQ-dependent oxidase [Rhodococcus koreensis]